jgi:RNA polymerase sigma factor (sigma-70 family)
VTPDAVLGELEGLRALAHSLVHGDADAEDLIQETAVAAITHPPEEGRPVRPWLATVLRNRWRMDRRTVNRRTAREQQVAVAAGDVDPRAGADEVLDRARTLERLATALVALDEPFRTVVMRRYVDGQSAADIARALGVPAGTVRWRLKTGLERLRATLDESQPKWRRAFIPFAASTAKGAAVVKAKTTAISLVLLVLLIVSGVVVWVVRKDDTASTTRSPAIATAGSAGGSAMPRAATGSNAGDVLQLADPLPGQGRARVEPVDAAGGLLQGRVINWSTGDGVANAELTFTSSAGATTVRSKDDGVFELAPAMPGSFTLAAVVAQGFLPFAPELTHSSVRAELVARQSVRGVTVFLFPAIPYQGHVVDAAGKPVPGAKVRLVGTPADEQALEKLATEWTTDAKGLFTFNAPDGAVFEAVRGGKRGWAAVTGDVATTRQMTIKLGDAPARDASIRGKTVDKSGAPIAEVLVRAIPDRPPNAPNREDHTRTHAFALSGPDGSFVLEGLDTGSYMLLAEIDEYAPLEHGPIKPSPAEVVLTLDAGQTITGRVETSSGEPVPAYTLLVLRRTGLVYQGLVDRSVVDPRGAFSVRVPPGNYELLASAAGWAPSKPTPASGGAKDVKIVVATGATLRGKVVDAETGQPLEYARVAREGASGGASAQPANAGTVTRADGTFELTGIPAGPLSFSIGAGEYHPRLEGGHVAVDGGVIGPIQIALKKLAPGETPKIDLVGIGVKLAADGDTLKIEEVVPGGGAADAGMLAGDRITAIDGIPLTELGMQAAIARIRGVAGTTIAVAFLRGETPMNLVVTRKPLRF